ncbi:MAG: BrnT family toxin [Dehalococcoidia bacterium]|nr:BrnT family toxin [Dehalococcoidia bacterium]
MRWTWDQSKNEANLQAHGLSFEAAAFVFDDPLSLTRADPYPCEERWRTMGIVGTQIVMVVHTWPDLDAETGEEIGRIISARKATRHERDAYEEGRY